MPSGPRSSRSWNGGRIDRVVRESPEIAAVVRRIGEAWSSRDYDTYAGLISDSPHFRGIGSDADEFWESAESFLGVRRAQADELDKQGWGQSEAVADRLEAFEDGHVGWASWLLTIQTPAGAVNLRGTAVLVLEGGAWRVIQWHNSAPSPNVQTFGVELTTTIDDLLASVETDDAALDALDRTEGTLTLMFTDIVDSTALAEEIGDDGWLALIDSHESAIRRLTRKHGGIVVKMLGDGSMLAFNSSRGAVRAALDIQRSTHEESYEVRIGLHAGEVVRREGDFQGITVNKAARVASAAGAGQILASAIVAQLVGEIEGIRFEPAGTFTLKGLSGTHELVHLESSAFDRI